ncbi:MAG: acetolactate synthase small subunit [Bacillota bacterium]|jgi:acetolactate synthase I/III small subunit|nr:acetolactate synthase small subunit [Bacillota bacterium]
MKQVLAVIVENKPGALTRVSGLFSRRGFNIENIAVGETVTPGISRMTITVEGSEKVIEQVVKQLHKLINVIKVSNLSNEPSVMRELMLLKVKAETGFRSDIQQIVETFRGKVVDVSPDSMIIEVTGNDDKLEAIKLLLQHFGIKEIVRTGKVAMLRGSMVTRES